MTQRSEWTLPSGSGSACSWIRNGMKRQLLQSCPTLCDPMNYSPAGSSVHGILQARIVTEVGYHALLQGSNPHFLHLLHWQADSLPSEPPKKPHPPGQKHPSKESTRPWPFYLWPLGPKPAGSQMQGCGSSLHKAPIQESRHTQQPVLRPPGILVKGWSYLSGSLLLFQAAISLQDSPPHLAFLVLHSLLLLFQHL